VLNRITSQRKKRDFLVYDMEWIPGKLEIRLVGIYDGHRYRAFYKVDDFLDAMLTRENADKWFYAHYGGMADAQFLLECLAKRVGTYEIDASFSGSSAIIIHVTRGAMTWHFIDSFWLLRDRLAKIGEAVGLEKMGEEYICDNFPECGHVDEHQARYLEPGDPYCIHEWDEDGGECIKCSKEMSHPMCVFWAPMGELKTYNERDCVILHKAVAQFEDTLMQLGGQLQMTIASCAMHLFRRKYLQSDIRTNAAVNGWARLAYTSSRVEVFQTHCHNASYFDLNSSFPYAMTFPCPGNVKRLRDKKLPKFGNIYLAECDVEVPQMYLPPLPYRHDGRVFFPIGKWRSWFSNLDLELLEKRGGRIHKVYQSIEFEQQSSLTDYAVDIYEKRKASKTTFEKLVFKYLLNSLYGKFGERTEKTSMLLHPGSTNCPHTPKHRCASWPACVHAIAGNECNNCIQPLFPGCLLVTNEAELAHEWVPIAVHITARARANLEGHLWNAQEDIYYCDSVAEDRPTVLLSPNGHVVIRDMRTLWDEVFAEVSTVEERGKEFKTPPDGWMALSMSPDRRSIWSPLTRIIRHRSGKEMVRITTPHGESEVTTDHAIMKTPVETWSADQMIATQGSFLSGRALPPPLVCPFSDDDIERVKMSILDGSARLSDSDLSMPREAFDEIWRRVNAIREFGSIPLSHMMAAQISYLASIHSRFAWPTRRGEALCLGVFPRGVSIFDIAKPIVRRRAARADEFVYDLSVEGTNTFVDGVGRALLHNTDSVITTVNLPSDPKTLGALKLEDTIESGEFIACKIYAVDVHRDDKFMAKHPDAKPSHWKTKAKGFSRMNYKKFCDVKIGEEIKIARMTRIRELYRKGQTVPEENIVGKRLVQKCMPKRCMLPGGQSRPWLIEEVEQNYMRTDVGIEPVRLAGD
jgi:hypothetical protein